jgi:antitoxin component YwqK of YwqJK toxin-antitoxin module
MNRLLTLILLLFSSFLASGQKTDTIYFDANWKVSNHNNSAYYRIDKKENDRWLRTDYYRENNQMQMRGYVSSRDPEIKTGYFEWFYPNGKILHIGHYADNKEVGEHTWYYENGHKEAIANFRNGKLDGEYREFHDNGKISMETSFRNDVQEGLTKFFRNDGSLAAEGEFKNDDRTGTWKYYDKSGKMVGTHEFKTEYQLKDAGLYIKLPNSFWSLADKRTNGRTQYIFRREPIIDSLGRAITPSIMLFVEDASQYKQDVTQFSIVRQTQIKEQGVETEKILTPDNDEDYPLSIKKSYIFKCHYTDGTSVRLEHLLYMVYIITREDKGIQMYMDMTKSVAPGYEEEFISIIKSMKEISPLVKAGWSGKRTGVR